VFGKSRNPLKTNELRGLFVGVWHHLFTTCSGTTCSTCWVHLGLHAIRRSSEDPRIRCGVVAGVPTALFMQAPLTGGGEPLRPLWPADTAVFAPPRLPPAPTGAERWAQENSRPR